jgi:hypothetical protein
VAFFIIFAMMFLLTVKPQHLGKCLVLSVIKLVAWFFSLAVFEEFILPVLTLLAMFAVLLNARDMINFA